MINETDKTEKACETKGAMLCVSNKVANELVDYIKSLDKGHQYEVLHPGGYDGTTIRALVLRSERAGQPEHANDVAGIIKGFDTDEQVRVLQNSTVTRAFEAWGTTESIKMMADIYLDLPLQEQVRVDEERGPNSFSMNAILGGAMNRGLNESVEQFNTLWKSDEYREARDQYREELKLAKEMEQQQEETYQLNGGTPIFGLPEVK